MWCRLCVPIQNRESLMYNLTLPQYLMALSPAKKNIYKEKRENIIKKVLDEAEKSRMDEN